MNGPGPEVNSEVEKRFRISVLIVAAQIMSVAVLSAIAWLLSFEVTEPVAQSTLTGLWVLIIFIAVGTFLLRRMLFNWERIKNAKLLKGIGGVLAALQTNTIILGAMAEAVAVIGFVITTLSGNPYDMLRAAAIAIILLVIIYPRRSTWDTIVAGVDSV